MPEHPDRAAQAVRLQINGRDVMVREGTSVAAAILAAGEIVFRRSVTGEPRGPLCGMGVCMECRVEIDGMAHQKSCQILCRSGMEVIAR